MASHDQRGQPIDEPGVDLRGTEAQAAFEAAAPLFELVTQRGDGATLRSLSLHLERKRLLATFEPVSEQAATGVVRVDDGALFARVLQSAAGVIQLLAALATEHLARRKAPCLVALSPAELREASSSTLRHYNDKAEPYRQGTRDHDVSQNVDALLRHLPDSRRLAILDLGCASGRDLITFRELGHDPVGLDGAVRFVEMARQHSGCEVWHQDLLALDLPEQQFDGVFANASLFHVPSQELPRVLGHLWACLKPDGALFCSNPHGPNREGWSGDRYSCFVDLETFRQFMQGAGFRELEHYYRPAGRPRDQQPWLASVWRRAAASSPVEEG